MSGSAELNGSPTTSDDYILSNNAPTNCTAAVARRPSSYIAECETAGDFDGFALADVTLLGMLFVLPVVALAAVLYWAFASGKVQASFGTLALGYVGGLGDPSDHRAVCPIRRAVHLPPRFALLDIPALLLVPEIGKRTSRYTRSSRP